VSVDTKAVVTDCLESWSHGDFDTTRKLLANDVTFFGPLGATTGAHDYVEGVKNVAKIVDRVDIHKVIDRGDDVCVMYDLITQQGDAIPTVGWYEVREGKVASVRAFFDPRPLLAS
jgi:ketosteroid isomerase-like protein